VTTKVGRLVKAPFTPARSSIDTTQGPGAGETAIFRGALPFRIDVDYGYAITDAILARLDPEEKMTPTYHRYDTD
jgi:hypothetical protein